MIERNRTGIHRCMRDGLANPATLQRKSDGSRIAVGLAERVTLLPRDGSPWRSPENAVAPHDALVILLVLLPGAAGYAQQPNPGQMPLHERGYLYLLAANLGTSIIPWALLSQPSASVDKGLGVPHMRAARIETLAGVLLCQTISSVLLIASAATLGVMVRWIAWRGSRPRSPRRWAWWPDAWCSCWDCRAVRWLRPSLSA